MATSGLSGFTPVLALLTIILHGCTKHEIVQDAKANVAYVACDEVASGVVQGIETTSVVLLEKLCSEWHATNKTDTGLSRAERLAMNTECLGDGASSMMENLKKGREELAADCEEHVLAELDKIQRNGSALILNVMLRIKLLAHKWRSKEGSAIEETVRRRTTSDMNVVGERSAEQLEEKREAWRAEEDEAGSESPTLVEKTGDASESHTEQEQDADEGTEHDSESPDPAVNFRKKFVLPTHIRGAGRSALPSQASALLCCLCALILSGAAVAMIRRDSTSSSGYTGVRRMAASLGEEHMPFVGDLEVPSAGTAAGVAMELERARAQVQELEEQLHQARFKLRWQELRRVADEGSA